ncbi:Lish domain-containing protein fopnl, partial [Globisporangium splendens]
MDEHANLSDLKDVLKDTLEARGSLNQIKARIRAEIFAALDDQDVPKPKLSNENLIINELVREYLEYNGYRHALSVFLPESGQPTEKPFHRGFLAAELNSASKLYGKSFTLVLQCSHLSIMLMAYFGVWIVEEDSHFAHVPLLCSVVANLQQSREQSEVDASGLQQIDSLLATPTVNMLCQDPADKRNGAPLRSSSPRPATAGALYSLVLLFSNRKVSFS